MLDVRGGQNYELFFCASRRRHTRCALVTGVQTWALPISEGKLAASFNEIVASNRRLAAELARVGQKVGRQGQTRQRIAPAARQGAWAEMEQSVNHLIDDLVRPVETITEAIAGVAKGEIGRAHV